MADVAEYLNAAIVSARQQMPERRERWEKVSNVFGSYRISSLLVVDVKRLGTLDIILCN